VENQFYSSGIHTKQAVSGEVHSSAVGSAPQASTVPDGIPASLPAVYPVTFISFKLSH